VAGVQPEGVIDAGDKLTDNQAEPLDWAKDVVYNGAGQITEMKYYNGSQAPLNPYYTETRSYNSRMQLTRLTVSGTLDHEYRFSDTQNNGRITQRKDWVSGEEITYQYDSLNRLISAVTTGPEWGQSFGYDGFGNLLSQTVTKGSAPMLSINVNASTNRITTSGFSYDANGNLTAMPFLTMNYDIENRRRESCRDS
jgi:YD repeat-containing protein